MNESTNIDDAAADAVNASGDVPEGWTFVELTKVCELNPPKPAQDSLDETTPVTFVPMPAVDAESGSILTPSVRPFGEVRKGFTAFRDGDVIFAKITPCMENGKSAIAGGLTNGLGFGSTEFHVLRPTSAVLAEYIHYFVRQESFRRAAAEEMTGSVGQKRVPAAYLEAAGLPLPPLVEQRRIIAKINCLFAEVSKARKHILRAAALVEGQLGKPNGLLATLPQAILAKAFRGELVSTEAEVARIENRHYESATQLLARIFSGRDHDPESESTPKARKQTRRKR